MLLLVLILIFYQSIVDAVWLRKLKQGLCINLGGGVGRQMGRRFKKEGIYVYL